ncbi:MAG: ribosome maturation factor RimM [Desulfotalea sp.]
MSSDYNFPEEKYILIGAISKAHGMKGEVKVYSYSGQPESFCDYRNITLISQDGEFSPQLSIQKTRPQGKMAIMLLETVSDRNRAEDIEGMGILIEKKDLPPIDDDEFYWHQLIGKKVIDKDNKELGKVVDMFSNGAQDLMVISTPRTKDILVPVVDKIILKFDDEYVQIDPPQGLLDLNTESN